MTDIYDKFDAATRAFEAYAILRDGKPVGRIVIKFGNAATAYVQVWGVADGHRPRNWLRLRQGKRGCHGCYRQPGRAP